MKLTLLALVLSCLGLSFCSCSAQPSHQLYTYDYSTLIPGPGEDGYDAQLEATARMRDRQFHVFHTLPTGLNAEVRISVDKTEERAAVERFLLEDDGWDFESFSGYKVEQVVDSWWKVAGAYAGAGLAADAFRYGTMRDQNYPEVDVDLAREQFLKALDGLALAVEINGVEGVIVRGFANTTYAGDGQNVELVPLYDEDGNPLPEEKNNGTWRADNSGKYPDYVWEDSCSRDMLIGWVLGFGAAWEVMADDGSIPDSYKTRLRKHASELVHALMRVPESGYDLEIPDADGRPTFHAYMNENYVDRLLVPGIRNGFYSIMALGIVGTFAYVTQETDVVDYLENDLIKNRDLPTIAAEHSVELNLGNITSFSNYNMAFDGAWLALRYIRDQHARSILKKALSEQLYDTPGEDFQPIEEAQSLYDFVYVTGMCGASAENPCTSEVDESALERGMLSLRDFPAPPFWDTKRENCDPAELESGVCVADDGVTELTVLGEVGRKGSLIVAEPIPMKLRPPSNYYWRSNPYEPNGGGDGSNMLPGPDFRLAYWLGRWVRR